MAKTIALILGIVFILVGLIGFVAPNLLGAHLTTTHNIIHLVSGLASVYFGWMGTLAAAKMFDIAFGIVYGLLGLLGFVMGSGAERMWDVIPGALMLGTPDHVIHILLSALYLIGGLLTRDTGRVLAND